MIRLMVWVLLFGGAIPGAVVYLIKGFLPFGISNLSRWGFWAIIVLAEVAFTNFLIAVKLRLMQTDRPVLVWVNYPTAGADVAVRVINDSDVSASVTARFHADISNASNEEYAGWWHTSGTDTVHLAPGGSDILELGNYQVRPHPDGPLTRCFTIYMYFQHRHEEQTWEDEGVGGRNMCLVIELFAEPKTIRRVVWEFDVVSKYPEAAACHLEARNGATRQALASRTQVFGRGDSGDQ